MSTPSVTILKNLVLNWESNQMEEETIATFYRHYDGYPSCHAIDIANSLVVASRTKPEHIDFSGASVERDILNNRNWCQHFLKAMCMADADIEFIGEDNVPSASYTYVVTGAYDNFGGKVSIGAEEYLSRINIKVYEGDENGNLVFEGGAAECLALEDAGVGAFGKDDGFGALFQGCDQLTKHIEIPPNFCAAGGRQELTGTVYTSFFRVSTPNHKKFTIFP